MILNSASHLKFAFSHRKLTPSSALVQEQDRFSANTNIDPCLHLYSLSPHSGTSLVSILSSNLVFHPLILHALKRVDYYTEAAPLTLGSLIGMGGPMMILAFVAMAMVFVLPKITATLDPEAQKELADSQARMQKRLAAVQSGDVSSLLYKDDYVKKGQDREKAANQVRAQRNAGPSK